MGEVAGNRLHVAEVEVSALNGPLNDGREVALADGLTDAVAKRLPLEQGLEPYAVAAALLGLYAAADADPAVRAILVAVVAIVGVVGALLCVAVLMEDRQ